MKNYFLYGFFVILLFTLTACGRRNETPQEALESGYSHEAAEGNIPAGNVPGSPANNETSAKVETENTWPVRTLSVLMDSGRRLENVIHQAAASMDNFNLELTVYDGLDFENNFNRLNTMLMAGQGYDLFFWAGHNLVHWAQSGYLADFYTLIDECPVTNRADFYTQVLAANEINGGVYAFPLSFGFHYILVNNNLPQSIINEFTSKSTITMSELMALYAKLLEDYGTEFGHLDFVQGSFLFDPFSMIASYIGGFLDFANHTVNLTNNDFKNFINDIAFTFPRWDINAPIGTGVATHITGAPFLAAISGGHAFFAAHRVLDPVLAFIEPPHFSHGIPVADSQGRLIADQAPATPANSTWATVCIATAGDTALAWEFTRYLIEAFSQPLPGAQYDSNGMPKRWGRYSLVTPIKRSLFDSHVSTAFNTLSSDISYSRFLGIIERCDCEEYCYCEGYDWHQVEQLAVSQLNMFNEMPITLHNNHIPLNLILEDIVMFMRGAMTAEVFAQTVENRLWLWMIE